LKYLKWCDNCQVPLVGETCELCGAKGKIIKPDLRPIFTSEKDSLELEFGYKLPFPLYYGASGWIYAMGNAIGRMSLRKGKPTFTPTNFYFTVMSTYKNISMEEFKYKVIEANRHAISLKEKEAITFIQDTIKDYRECKPVVAFSGGKDSTVTAALVQQAIGQATLFFGDTTIEFPDTYQYINRISNCDKYRLITEKPAKNFYESAEELGPPSQSLRWCCTVVKASPLNNFIANNPVHRLFFDGIRRRESSARENYERVTGNKKSVNQIVGRPILEWTTMDVWLYIWWRNLDYNTLYDKGYGRAGCMYCPNNTRYDAYLTRGHFPEEHTIWESILAAYFDVQNSDKKISSKEKAFWVDYGWKHRLPHRGKVFVGKKRNWSSGRCEIEFNRPIDSNFVDFLIPTGNVLVGDRGFISVSTGSTRVDGRIGSKKIQIKGEISRQLNKAIIKYLNCFGCGACVGSCPAGAIFVDEGKLRVDMEKCNKCEACLGTRFLGSGCVSLTYKSICSSISEANEVTGPVPQVNQ
jgi:phosphoadenosine phosphosulfate reductase